MKNWFLLLLLVCLAGGSAWAQRTLTGTVTDVNGEPLVGASVLAKGTTTGTVSDIDGTYSLTVPDGTEALIFSYTGYASQEIPVGVSNVIDVTLEESASQLSEVVVVGYGSQIKSTVTGNIAKVDGADLANLPVPSVEQALQGRAAGVFIQSVNGKPGGRINMRIRGSSSVTADNQPLYVVDGVPITSGTFTAPGSGNLNFLADLNTNDIESIEVLKDASAAAIYGSRAANGVVLITTKSGRDGQSRINFNAYYGFSNPTNEREFLNAGEYVDFFRQTALGAARYDWANQIDDFGLGDDYTEENIRQAYLDFVEGRFTRYSGHADWTTGEVDTDWQQEAFQQGGVLNGDLSVQGGNAGLQYYASLGYSDQEGIMFANGFERITARLNLDARASEKLNYGMRLSTGRTTNERVPDDNQFATPLQLVALAPITPVRNTTNAVFNGFDPGQLYDTPVTSYYNGMINEVNADIETVSYRTLGNLFAQYRIAGGLSLRGEAGVDLANIKQNRFLGRLTNSGRATNGFADSRWTEILNYNARALLLYNTAFGAGHSLDLTGGMEWQRSNAENIEVDAQEFPVDDLRTIASAADVTFGTTDRTAFSFTSYFGRANYNFNRKYLLSISARLDGSSRFGANNRYGFFPAVSAGWVLSEENFLTGNQTLSFLKLRASYGLTGNASIDNFGSLGLYGGEGYAQTPGLQPTQLANPDLTWEQTTQFDVGVDFGWFSDRLTGEVDYYIKNTTDLLLQVPVPSTSGFRDIFRNVGEIQNRGVELLLNANVLTGDFKWTTGFNFAFNKNEVTRLADGQDIIDDGGSRYMNVVKVGEPIGAFYGYQYAGVDPANGDALFYVNATDDNGNIIDPTATTNDVSDANFVILGNAIPDKIAGWTNSFSWQGFSLDVFLQGSFGNQIHNSAGVFMSCGACWFDNQTRDQLRAWKQPGDITDVPEARFYFGNGDISRSSRYLEDGDFIRLKTVTLSYALPNRLMQNAGMQSLRLYVTGQNLLTFTDYTGWDPEVATDFLADDNANIYNSIDFYAAPQARTIIFGLSVGF